MLGPERPEAVLPEKGVVLTDLQSSNRYLLSTNFSLSRALSLSFSLSLSLSLSIFVSLSTFSFALNKHAPSLTSLTC